MWSETSIPLSGLPKTIGLQTNCVKRQIDLLNRFGGIRQALPVCQLCLEGFG